MKRQKYHKLLELIGPGGYIISTNLHRRHLTTSQRALIAAKIKPMFEEEAKKRRLANLKVGKAISESANLRHREEGKSSEKTAKVFNVSPRLVEDASKVLRHISANLR